MKAKKNISNVELVRQYDLKNGLTTARQAGADLDLTPQQVYQIRWNIRNKFKKPTPKVEAVQVPKEWEEDAEQMAQSVKEDSSWKVTAPGGAVDTIERLVAEHNSPSRTDLPCTQREATALAEQIVESNIKNTQLNVELARARIIIKYLEERVEELSVRR